MNIIANENVYEPIIDFLRSEGHQVLSVREGFSGVSDNEIYRMATEAKLTILTMDKDFTRFLRFPPAECGGIIVLKLYKITVERTTQLFTQYFKTLDEEKIRGQLVIINREGVRLRTAY